MVFEGRKLGLVAAGTMLVMLALAAAAGIGTAYANQCAASCYDSFQACSAASKGDPSCSRALSQCLASCRGR